ncbi:MULTISPECIES: sodium-translocating pyrophosphatase [unclassified Methanoregula]|uniref:sodium-translocating pyrophosphatase n=1 Tax=unclassified Methanoregula TaxID=2649730 RepID=UPI0009CB3944|nr:MULTISPECIES: sodium-translocating pyrophosphatase [unclassified Methanoregula]OPX64278.1 MAG: K(+)-stimulated pyrophosphate-energized sodium pump [Methanoregula sp. PtaB.Bin085]OPY33597.1 MAG: K(+)-stimulated pyrophosphate-energized sodium pump [Methanoregula sp. PtaU1.Bin006]
MIDLPLQIVIAICILALALAAILARNLLAQDQGTPKMREVSDAIRVGAEAFVKRQYSTIAILAVVLALVIFVVYFLTGQSDLALATAAAYIVGATCSAVAGIVAMYVAVRANIRTAAAAQTSDGKALDMSFHGGAVSGLIIASMSLLGVSITYIALGADPLHTPFVIVGFGFGASFVALFAQLGGGIYTKAADVGADLVGKVEAGIPEDDVRNPAVVADLVGDNVGDCAGRGADLFESTAAENIGAMILGVALFPVFGVNGILFPIVMCAFGLLASMIGILCVRGRDGADPMDAMNMGYYITAAISAVFLFFGVQWLLGASAGWMYFFFAGLIGIILSVCFLRVTLYYTDHHYRPVQEIADASETGAATNIISGFSVALETTAIPAILIGISLLLSYWCGTQTGIANGGLYGTAVATIGMLMVCAYVLAMDTFGPIADNAGGIVEMSQAPDAVRHRMDKLDAAGNTTKALTKGYAIGSASLAVFLLFNAYMADIAKLTGKAFEVVNLAKVDVFVGGLLGAMLVFLFASFAIRAVSKTAQSVIEAVRVQFKDNAIMAGDRKPDYAAVIDITTSGALRNMVLPGILVVGFPVIIGMTMKYEALAGFLMVGTIAGILLALILNNGGGAWDNAKKYIEAGAHGGKKSEAHKAAVIGDTLGDPFKDTAGPSLHVLIKLLATLTLVLAPLFI